MSRIPRLHVGIAAAMLVATAQLLLCPRIAASAISRSTANTVDGTWVQFPTVIRPGAVSAAGFFYDGLRGRFIRFGGRYGATKLNDLWTATATEPVRWSPLVASGTPPSARFGHTMAYDSARDRLLVFGGTADGTAGLGDTWELTLGTNPPAWNPIAVTGSIPGRFAHVGVYDPVGDRLVVFGGISGGVRKNDTWQLSLAGTPTWSQMSFGSALPSARNLACAIYDPAGARMVMFGGDALLPGPTLAATNDTWALSLGASPAWSALAPAGTLPSRREGCVAFYDPVRQWMVMIGGGGSSAVESFALTLGAVPAWSAISYVGTAPSPRTQVCLAYDAAQDRAVLYGGLGFASESNDGFALSLAGTPRWSEFEPSPLARLGAAGAYDALRHQLVLFGGTEYRFSGPAKAADTWATALDGQNNWDLVVAPKAPAPPPRSDALMVADAAHDRVLLFAGVGDQYDNDVWQFDLGTRAWSLFTAPPPPAGRLAMAGVYDAAHDRLIVFGGLNGQTANNETWQFAFSPSFRWTQLTVAGTPPSPRYGHSLVYDSARDRVLVFGGANGAGSPNGEVWSLNLSGPPVWT